MHGDTNVKKKIYCTLTSMKFRNTLFFFQRIVSGSTERCYVICIFAGHRCINIISQN